MQSCDRSSRPPYQCGGLPGRMQPMVSVPGPGHRALSAGDVTAPRYRNGCRPADLRLRILQTTVFSSRTEPAPVDRWFSRATISIAPGAWDQFLHLRVDKRQCVVNWKQTGCCVHAVPAARHRWWIRTWSMPGVACGWIDVIDVVQAWAVTAVAGGRDSVSPLHFVRNDYLIRACLYKEGILHLYRCSCCP